MVMMLSISAIRGNRYPAVYVASYVGRKSEVKKCRQKGFRSVTSFFINLLNNKTIILLNLAEYRLILADEAVGRVG